MKTLFSKEWVFEIDTILMYPSTFSFFDSMGFFIVLGLLLEDSR